MIELVQFLLPGKLLAIVLKPLVRLILGLVAAPLFHLFLHRVVRVKDLDEELERDITLWLRGSLMLLIATRNMESTFFNWVPVEWREEHIWLLAARLLLAIGVIEGMPDQALFSIIHPGPPRLQLERGRIWRSLRAYVGPFCKGLVCQHLNRSSPVLAILTVFLPGRVGWICYALAIANYLIIGLVSSKDRALDVLQRFDAAVQERRDELAAEVDRSGGKELTAEQLLAAAEQSGPFSPPPPAAPP